MMRGSAKKLKIVQCVATEEIIAGDIVFYFDHGKRGSTLVEHVGICVGRSDKNVPQIAHATIGSRFAEVTVTDLLKSYGYLVYRLTNEQLAHGAARIALQWATQEQVIPYDHERRRLMEAFLDIHDDVDEALNTCLNNFSQEGFYRALKFAVRHEQPIRSGSRKGFRCDQFVILCFQVAELHLKNERSSSSYFFTLQQMRELCDVDWVSISHGDLNKISSEQERKEYCIKFNQKTPRTRTAPITLAAADWVLKEQTDFVLPLDAKCCSPSVLLKWLEQSDSSSIHCVGVLAPPEFTNQCLFKPVIDYTIVKIPLCKRSRQPISSEGDHFYAPLMHRVLGYGSLRLDLPQGVSLLWRGGSLFMIERPTEEAQETTLLGSRNPG